MLISLPYVMTSSRPERADSSRLSWICAANCRLLVSSMAGMGGGVMGGVVGVMVCCCRCGDDDDGPVGSCCGGAVSRVVKTRGGSKKRVNTCESVTTQHGHDGDATGSCSRELSCCHSQSFTDQTSAAPVLSSSSSSLGSWLGLFVLVARSRNVITKLFLWSVRARKVKQTNSETAVRCDDGLVEFHARGGGRR